MLISLTTIRPRLPAISAVIRSLREQSLVPDEIHLYVSEEPYLIDPGIRRADLPAELLEMERGGEVFIHFVPNTGPFRKLLPLLREKFATKCAIVTADDDLLVPFDWLERLVSGHLANPGKVIAFRNRRVLRHEGALRPYLDWPLVPPGAAPGSLDPLDLFPTGCEGILYQPGFFSEAVFDRAYLELCPKADDIWFKLQTLGNGIGVAGVKRSWLPGKYEFSNFETGRLKLSQDNWDVQAALNNDSQLRRVLKKLAEDGRLTDDLRPASRS